MWDVADKSINYCSNDLKKLPDVLQSTNSLKNSELKKYSMNSSLSKKLSKTT